MKNKLTPIFAFLLAACVAPAVADEPQQECLCMSPLDEFVNSPRRFRNDDGSEVVSSSLIKLGPGIVASRPVGAPGEATFATLDAPDVASQAAQIAALTARLATLEQTVEPVHVCPPGYSTRAVSAGTILPTDCGLLGIDEGLKIVLPESTSANVGQRITVTETAGNQFGTTDSYVRIGFLPYPGQAVLGLFSFTMDGDNVYLLTGFAPTCTLASTGTGWIVVAHGQHTPIP